MISLPDSISLQPHHIDGVYCFPSENTTLVKLDILFEAGSSYQSEPLAAAAANKLLAVATRRMDATRLAEFLDYRGVVVETNNDVLQSSLTIYFLRRFADEVIPVVAQMLHEPAYNSRDFEVWRDRKRQEISTLEQQTSHQARRLFYQTLFGASHPLGRYATPPDTNRLTLDIVKDHYDRFYNQAACTVVVAGMIDDELLALLHRHVALNQRQVHLRDSLPIPQAPSAQRCLSVQIPDAVQSTLRVGRLLPLRWDEMDYARFMLLTTLLGGWFGSRLMSNLREDKGYTYGVYARTQIYRGLIVFYITTDVAVDVAEPATQEILNELERLVEVDEDELLQVKTVLASDFVRSVDGVLERSSRFCDMYATCLTEQLTDNIRRALHETTAAQLQELAQRLLNPEEVIVCRAGV